MKKYLLCLSLFTFYFYLVPLQAQDTLVLNNGQKMSVKVISVTDKITYTIPPSDAPVYIKLSKVYSIKYKDGSVYSPNPLSNSTQSANGSIKRADAGGTVFSITTDLAQYATPQPNIGVEFRIISPLYVGANFGWVLSSSIFAVNPLADGQFTNPGTVYSGYTVRIYAKYFPSSRLKNYWSIQGVFKSLSFNNVNFQDDYGDSYTNLYSMSEHATTIGFDLLHGNILTKAKSECVVDLFYGFGVHTRNRVYTISNQRFGYFGAPLSEYQSEPIAYDGTYPKTLSIFTPVVGLRIGFGYISKK